MNKQIIITVATTLIVDEIIRRKFKKGIVGIMNENVKKVTGVVTQKYKDDVATNGVGEARVELGKDIQTAGKAIVATGVAIGAAGIITGKLITNNGIDKIKRGK